MKRNKLAKKLTAALLTGAMVMSMGGMTAFAEVTAIDLKKNVATDGNTYAPNETFNFSIISGAAGSLENGDLYFAGNDTKDGTIPLTANGIEFSSADGMGTSGIISQDGTISIDASKYEKSGIYHYVLSEIEPSSSPYEGIEYSKEKYDVFVYVQEKDSTNETYEVVAVTSKKEGTDSETTNVVDGKEEKTSAIEFTNHYGDSENDDEINELTITKTVSGAQGEKGKSFTFDITVTAQNGKNEKYKIVKVDKDGIESDLATLESGKENTYTEVIKSGESIKIYGLSKGDIVTVDEADYYTADHYKTTYTKSESGFSVQEVKDTDVTGNENYITGTVTGKDAVITVENSKDAATPTGIAMTFAPYAVMVAFAGVFAVMFLRKKREDF